jgi:hypothetical protein
MQIKKLAVAAAASGALALSLVSAAPASADYAPSSSDVVGVGSDTVQFAIDFMADGDYAGNTGFNATARNKVINFDATPDANARLAYGAGGLNGTSITTSNCAPGTGGSTGTGNQSASHTGDRPCVLNPTIVLRAGLKPVQRPNGSGAGYNALKADDAAASHNIDFARASSARTGGATYSSVTLGTDILAMLTSSTTHAPAGGLTVAQLTEIYKCTAGYTDWSSANFGGNVANAGTIIPLLPQVGSGTRGSFLSALGLTDSTVGACTVNAEENDPEAIDASGSAINAIEPMSSGRLNMYQGKDSAGTSLGTGYFLDPSCAYAQVAAAAAISGTNQARAACVAAGTVLAPNVTYNYSGGTGTFATAWSSSRNMYLYFRAGDVNSTTIFQPGGTRNWVRTLFANPCSGTTAGGTPIVSGTNCTSSNTYGPGGAPFIATAPGQALVSSAGIVPSYTYSVTGA